MAEDFEAAKKMAIEAAARAKAKDKMAASDDDDDDDDEDEANVVVRFQKLKKIQFFCQLQL